MVACNIHVICHCTVNAVIEMRVKLLSCEPAQLRDQSYYYSIEIDNSVKDNVSIEQTK